VNLAYVSDDEARTAYANGIVDAINGDPTALGDIFDDVLASTGVHAWYMSFANGLATPSLAEIDTLYNILSKEYGYFATKISDPTPSFFNLKPKRFSAVQTTAGPQIVITKNTGDNITTLEASFELHQGIPNSVLAIVPGGDHGESDSNAQVAKLVHSYLLGENFQPGTVYF
jgi:hypothetical protein